MPQWAWASYGNYNTILVGEKSAGMGGAFTGMIGDPSASSFYNPATLALMKGTSLSATANIYSKIDTNYNKNVSLVDSASKVNQGSFRSIPSASGSISAFGKFALGLSIIVPNYDFYNGYLKNITNQTTTLQLLDESLWVGGSFALNVDDKNSFGFTIYYTSHFFQRSLTDELVDPGGPRSQITNEEVSYTNNSIVYVLGYFHKLTDKIKIGASIRPPSIEISGKGQVFRSDLDTNNSLTPITNSLQEIPSELRIPWRAAVGISYEEFKNYTLSLDVSYHGSESYYDLDRNNLASDNNLLQSSTHLQHVGTWNISLGTEFYMKEWLRWRLGWFTNRSSFPAMGIPTERRGDHLDMWGFSSNLAIFTSDKIAFTLGGYLTSGEGEDVQFSGQQLVRIDKNKRLFSFVVGSVYFF